MKNRSPKLTNQALRCAAILGMAAITFATASAQEAIAKIGDTEIKAEELRLALDSLGPDEQAALIRDPAALSQLVRSLLIQRIVV